MFNALKKQILGNKAASSTKKAVPIFQDVGIIGCPQPLGEDDEPVTNTVKFRSVFESVQDDAYVSRDDDFGAKRTRHRTGEVEQILQDKENVPKIPKIANTNNKESDDTSKHRKSVVIEESKNKSFLDDKQGDTRFSTKRSQGDKVKSEFEDDAVNADFSSAASSVPRQMSSMDDDETEERLRMRDFLFSKVRHNHYEVVEAAVKGKSHDFTGRFSVDNNGNTLVHVAVQNNLKKMCILLLKDAGCDLNVENFKGMTPLDYSQMYKFTALSEWLLLRGAINGSAPR